MADFTFATRIAAEPEAVFDAFIDIDTHAQRLSGVVRSELLTDGPVGVGTRFCETRVMFKRETTEQMEFTAFDRPRSFTIGCASCGVAWSAVHTFAPEDGGTRVEMRMSSRPVSLMAKLMSPLSFLFAGPMRKCIEADLEDMRQSLESDAPPAPADT